jgi:hypothetical protein
MNTPSKIAEPYRDLMNMLLEVARKCQQGSRQRDAFIRICYMAGVGLVVADDTNYVSADTIDELATAARALLPLATTDEIQAIAVMVQYLEREAANARERQDFDAQTARLADNYRRTMKAKTA